VFRAGTHPLLIVAVFVVVYLFFGFGALPFLGYCVIYCAGNMHRITQFTLNGVM